ncbi:MAG TPA: tetratricopeptide repeat protein [Thermoanaerobaculia bacterium]|jgi:serine/threonine protein kinase/tetratricopeptide (TPR) repeat protein|nr:tetratricopeptide repeat protein [Thermoanaerobaculia bacterium]
MATTPTEPPDPSSQPTVVSGAGEGTVVWSAPPPTSRFPPGLLLAGRFRIVGFLGQGGMGDVYEAEDQELRERVALKTVRPAVLRVPGVIERFRREVQLARKVTHPNVCRLFDVFHHRAETGSGEEVAFFTMELLAGETLDKRLRRDGPMNEAEALPIARQMADGLAAAHRVGVVHRDFKSANVMLVPEDGGARAVVTDFGLAHGAEALSGGLTLHGDVLGTPEYMAPEQVTGGEITPKTDVYALGIVLYEMVTGSLPFLGDSALATAAKRLREDPPPPRLKRPGLAPAWEVAILRCLAREPVDRFTTVREALAALETSAMPAAPALPEPSKPRRWLLAVAILAILLGIAGGWWSWHRSRAVDPVTDKLPFELAAPESLPASPAARSFYAKGQKALARFKAEEAKRLFQQAIAAEPGFPLAHSALAEAWDQLGYKAEAARQAQQAEKLALRLPREDQLLVKARSDQLNGRPDKAVASYQALHAIHLDNVEFGLALADAQIGANQGKNALETLEGMRPHGTTKPDPRLDLAEARAAGKISDFARQQKAAGRALARGEQEGSSLLIARALVFRGMAQSDLGDPQGAIADFERAKQLYAKVADKRGMAEVLYTTAYALYHQGKMEEAQKYYQEARETYHDLGDRGGEVEMLFNLASVAGEQGKLDAAEKSFKEILKVSRVIGNRQAEAITLGNIGQALFRQGKLLEASQSIIESRTLYRELGDRQGEALQIQSLADVLADQLELAKAEAGYKEALELATSIGDQNQVAGLEVALGLVLAAEGDLDGAEVRYQSALPLANKLGDSSRAGEVQLSLASLQLEKGRLFQAEAAAQGALKEFLAAAVPSREAEAEAVLARIYLAQKVLPKARSAVEQAERLAAGIQEPAPRVQVGLAAAQVRAADGDAAGAIARLGKILGEATGVSALEVRLALGELEIAHGDRSRGRERLRGVEEDARLHGVKRIAAKAATALAGSG